MLIKDLGDLSLQDWLEGHPRAEVIEAYRNALAIVVRIQETTEQALEPIPSARIWRLTKRSLDGS